jgi:peptide/nickel transport system substrate-binding protein
MRRKAGLRLVRRLAVPAAATALGLVVAACTGGSNSGTIGGGSAATGHPKHGGTVTVGWQNATPNLIFPLPPATNTDGYNLNLTEQMWPLLVYSGDGAKSVIDKQASLYSSIAYSNGDKTLTITLKDWDWSDGVPITSRDFTFVYNLLKANVPNWNQYVPGLFPTDVASVSTPSTHTVVLNLTHSYNPTFYTEDVLSTIPLLPQHAWDKTSATGKVGNYDETTAGAKAVFSFLQQQGSDSSTFATNPLWKVVDGPWALSQFTASTGYYTYVPNKHYSGPDKPYLSKIINESFTTDTAELDEMRSGSSLDVGNLPFNDLKQSSVLKSEGYSLATLQVAGVAEIMPNLYNSSVGAILRQLYVRQALEDLIDRPQIVSKVYEGYADPGDGPVPLTASGPWASPLEKSGGPYPYSPSAAAALLKAHGWKVVQGGTSTCQRPGTGATDCGAGITAGEPLSFQLVYSSGLTGMAEQNAAIESSEEQAGVKLTLKSEPFNTIAGSVGTCTSTSHPASTCGWQLADFGYDPYTGLFPSGAGFFNTGGFNNLGGYSDPEMNQLINDTEYGSSTQAFFTYENYAAKQLPWLWLPDADYIFVYRSNIGGFAPMNPFSGSTNPQDWYYTS